MIRTAGEAAYWAYRARLKRALGLSSKLLPPPWELAQPVTREAFEEAARAALAFTSMTLREEDGAK